MDADVVIKVEGLSKKFCRSLKRSMLYGTVDVARNMLGLDYDRVALRKGEFMALDNVNFELKKGEALGVIGHNGSGKTTLLRLLTGIFPPDAGSITIRGRVGALIAVGAGFHPHMSGRENIYLNGTILGMSRTELDAKFADIVAFADIGEFIDAPVSTYSSGMTVRLGFAIAIQSRPEILFADEVLAVGDLEFVLKCYRKIAELRQAGGSIVLVSHSMQLIRNTCQKVVWIEHGRVVMTGVPDDVCSAYEKNSAGDNMKVRNDIVGTEKLEYDPNFSLTKISFVDNADQNIDNVLAGSPLHIKMQFTSKRVVVSPIVTVSLSDALGNVIFETYSSGLTNLRNDGIIRFSIASLNIRPGTYSCTVTVSEGEILNILSWHDKVYRLKIIGESERRYNNGLILVEPDWRVDASAT